MENKQIDILDILLILAKHKKFIIILTVFVSIVAVTYSLITPKYWQSTTMILPIKNENSNVNIGTSLLGIGSSIFSTSMGSEGQDLLNIINSRTFSEEVIHQFNLIEYFEITSSDSLARMHEALQKLNTTMKKISLDEESGLLSISIESKDKYFSAKIANFYTFKLEKYNISSRMSKGKQKRLFIEERVKKVQSEIDSLSRCLNTFQKKNNLINLESQMSSAITLYSDLVSQKITNDIELQYQKKIYSKNSPLVLALIEKDRILTEKIDEFENSETLNKIKYGIEFSEVPDLILEFSKINTQLSIQKNVFEYLYPQLESAKIEEIRDLPTIEVLDRAVPSGKRSRPKRALICIIAFFTALIMSSIVILIRESIFRSSSFQTFIKKLKSGE